MDNPTTLSHKIFLEETRREAKNTYTFVFSKPQGFEWDEGVSIQLANSKYNSNNPDSALEHIRHLSIISLPCENHVAFTTRITEHASPFKKALRNATQGEEFQIIDPVSKMVLKREGRRILLISAGVAISTMRPLIKRFVMDRSNIESLINLNIDSSGDYIYRDEIADFESNTKGFSNYYRKTRAGFYQVLKDCFDKSAIYYVTGSDQFIIAISKLLLKQGVALDSLILDKEEAFYRRIYESPLPFL